MNIRTNIRFVVPGVLLLTVGVLLGRWLVPVNAGNMPHAHMHDSKMAGEANLPATQYTCAMHPDIKQDTPGKCPICSMDLTPVVKAGSASTQALPANALQLDPAAAQRAQVQTSPVQQVAQPTQKIEVYGKLSPNQGKVYRQSSHIEGRIEQLAAHTPGQYIEKGQVIARIYSPELVTTQQELLSAYAQKSTQPALYQAVRQKLLSRKITPAQVQQVLDQGQPIQAFPVLADASGYLLTPLVQAGGHVRRGSALYEQAPLNTLWARLELYPNQMAAVQKGAPVSLQPLGVNVPAISTQLDFVAPTLTPGTQTLEARATLKAPPAWARPGLEVRAQIQSPVPGPALIVPPGAVLYTGPRSVVYVQAQKNGQTYYQMRRVQLGPLTTQGYVIEQGLTAGQQVVTNGAFLIDATAQLQGSPSMMDPQNTSVAATAKPTTKATVQKPVLKKRVVKAQKPATPAALLAQYLALKNALVNDNEAKALQIGLQVVAPAQAPKSLQSSVPPLQQAQDIEALRQAFIDFSNQLIAYVKAQPQDFKGVLYVQECPMANNDQGAMWLSAEEEIFNPYFGASMLTCGGVIEVLGQE